MSVKKRQTIMWTDDAGNGVCVVVGAASIGLDVGPVDSLSDGYLLEFDDADFVAWVESVVLPARDLALGRLGGEVTR
jgi:hypothetical protein